MLGEPVSMEEARDQLRMGDNVTDDDIVSALLVAAREYVEGYTGLVLTAREVVETFDGFPRLFDLASWPVRSISSVKYLDVSGAQVVLGAPLYRFSVARRPMRILSAGLWPSLYAAPGAVSVTIDAGYATPADVPQSIKLAILMLMQCWYDAPPDGNGVEVPTAVTALLRRWRKRAL